MPDGAELASLIEQEVAAEIKGLPTQSFRELSERLDALSALPGFGTAAAYGLSQAMLDTGLAHAAR